MIAPAATLPDGPVATARTVTSACPDVGGEKMARGTVTAFVVWNTTPLWVDTSVPSGIVCALPVSWLTNVTVPVAAVSTGLVPVALNVSVAVRGMVTTCAGTTPRVVSTAVAFGSAMTVRFTGCAACVRGTTVIVAVGSTLKAIHPAATTRATTSSPEIPIHTHRRPPPPDRSRAVTTGRSGTPPRPTAPVVAAVPDAGGTAATPAAAVATARSSRGAPLPDRARARADFGTGPASVAPAAATAAPSSSTARPFDPSFRAASYSATVA